MATITESFDTADSSTLGPLLTWSEIAGGLEIASNRATNSVGNTDCTGRAESDLAGVDHYAECVARMSTKAGICAASACVRMAAATVTYYSAQALLALDLVRIIKVVSGSGSLISSQVPYSFSAGVDYTVRCEVSGFDVSAIINGVTVVSATDADIVGGTRCGVNIYDDTTGRTTVDSFEAGDMGGSPPSPPATTLITEWW